jgi:phosphatidylinositol glycan class V
MIRRASSDPPTRAARARVAVAAGFAMPPRRSPPRRSPPGAPPSVFRVAVLARLATLALMLAFDALVRDYDTSGTLAPGDEGGHSAPASRVCRAAEGLSTWDVVHLHRVAARGYEHEHSHAFFPLVPALTGLLARLLGGSATPTGPGGGPSPCALAVSGLLLSNAAHVVAAVTLESLGSIVLSDPDLARSAAVLFAINPASVFHSAGYTESVFACVSVAACLCLETERKNLAAALFAAASATRSNGALTAAVFLLHDFVTAELVPSLSEVFYVGGDHPKEEEARPERRTRSRRASRGGDERSRRRPFFALRLVAFLARCLVASAPTVATQWFGYARYCAGAYASSPRPWCAGWPVPSIYEHVQSAYWNVGFLRYYEAKQAPNFLLAAPALGGGVYAAARWVKQLAARRGEARGGGQTRTTGGGASSLLSNPRAQPYLACYFLMASAALVAMHVQVATRFLSVAPAPFWFAAEEGRRSATARRCVVAYSLAFGAVGALMHPTFYPWT